MSPDSLQYLKGKLGRFKEETLCGLGGTLISVRHRMRIRRTVLSSNRVPVLCATRIHARMSYSVLADCFIH